VSPAPEDLRLMVVSDAVGDPDRLAEIAAAAFAGGATALQVREPTWDHDDHVAFVRRLRPAVKRHGARILLNGLAVPGADGVHFPARFLDAPVQVARRLFSGFSTHDPDELERAADAGADYALLAPVHLTTSKPEVPPIGVETAREWTGAARIPVLWLGGITAGNAPALAAEPCIGVAVRSAICQAEDPEAAARALRDALDRRG